VEKLEKVELWDGDKSGPNQVELNAIYITCSLNQASPGFPQALASYFTAANK